MPALVMALVANSKMLPYQFLPSAMQRTPATNNINHLDFIPDGPEFASPPAPTFSVANLDVKHGGAHHARALTYTSGRRRSAAAKLGWIIVGRWVVVVGPQTARNGVIAIDPHATRSGVAWDYSLAGTNDDMLRFGMMPCCGGVRRSTESDQKA
jgi:hypothetical protein